jgi:uncharacterized protein (TIGR02266 family)
MSQDQPPRDQPPAGAERRAARRVALIAEIEYSSDSPSVTRRLTDLSTDGLFIDTMSPLPAGTLISVRFNLPGDPLPLVVLGEVVWAQEHLGMGVRFMNLRPKDRDRIRAWVDTQT